MHYHTFILYTKGFKYKKNSGKFHLGSSPSLPLGKPSKNKNCNYSDIVPISYDPLPPKGDRDSKKGNFDEIRPLPPRCGRDIQT